MKSWMQIAAVVTFLAALGACGGATGPQGPAGATGANGGGSYVNRDDMYCNSSSTTTAGNAVFGSAACDATEDLPVSGGCIPGATSDLAPLVLDYPESWNFAAGPAEWHCQWRLTANVSESLIALMSSSKATICCVKHQ
jgi:hypothetical protein